MELGSILFIAFLIAIAVVLTYGLRRSLHYVRRPEAHPSPFYTRKMARRRSAELVLLLVIVVVLLLWHLWLRGLVGGGPHMLGAVMLAIVLLLVLALVLALVLLALADIRELNARYRVLRKELSEKYREGMRRAFEEDERPGAENGEDG